MTETQTTSQVLAALDAAVALALAAGFDADEIIDTVGAALNLMGSTS